MLTDKLIYSLMQGYKVYGNGLDLYEFARKCYQQGREDMQAECVKLCIDKAIEYEGYTEEEWAFEHIADRLRELK